MRYFPLTDADREEMRNEIGVKDTRELFSDIPNDKIYYSMDDIPSALPEDQLIKRFKRIAKRNTFTDHTSYIGGGVYSHFCPTAVHHLSLKGEFLTPYTPYQPEVSQGSLQVMYEYQTMIAMLTGMEVANASLYDGGTAAAEGALLALRKAKKRNTVLVAKSLHPEYKEIIESYMKDLVEFSVKYVDMDQKSGTVDLDDLKEKLDDDCAGFLFQSPNFFGVVEDNKKITGILKENQTFSVQVVAEAMSLPFLSTPGEADVDIVVGEAQSFGLPLSYGGPFLGFMAIKKSFIRQMPGRVVGQTVDKIGRRGYVLTLSTREQHIKREKATSNICTNQAWCALRASMYLAMMGKKGLSEVSKRNHLNTAYFVQEVEKLDHVEIKFKKNFFSEVVLDIKSGSVSDFMKKMEDKGIMAGIPLKWFGKEHESSVLVNFTELHDKADIDNFVKAIGDVK